MADSVEVRPVRPEEIAAVGELTARVYLGDGFVSPSSPYLTELGNAAGRAERAELLVAVDPESGRVAGAVALAAAGTRYSELAGPGEAEFRMLVVDPAARRDGLGAALVAGCVERARAAGCTALRLSTQREMTAAHRLYERVGFCRTPERDWEPVPEVPLLTYLLDLNPVYCDRCGAPVRAGGHDGCARAPDLEPPRWCALCRRRLVVQVVPTGWSARCSRHGAVTG